MIQHRNENAKGVNSLQGGNQVLNSDPSGSDALYAAGMQGAPSSQQLTDQALATQSELFKSYSEANRLYLNVTNRMLWFEFGGNRIGQLMIEGPEAEEFPKWRLIAKLRGEFPCHFTLVYINGGAVGSPEIETHKDVDTWFLLGGMGNNCQQYVNKNIVNKAAMLQEKSFFSAVSAKGGRAIYTFGGYENIEKVQLKGCEYYSIQEDKWYINEGI